MSKYAVQFQQGISLQQFLSEFGSEDQCRQAVFRMRWPDGFRYQTHSETVFGIGF